MTAAETVVLIEHSSPRSCAPLLRCSRYEVQVCSPVRGDRAPAGTEIAVKVIDQTGDAGVPLGDGRRELLAQAEALAARHTVIVHARSPARAVAELLREYAAQHPAGGLNVLSRESPSFAKDLLVTIEKLVGGDIFGLEKYLCWGAHVVELELRHTDEKYVALDLLQQQALELGLGSRARSLTTAADELIMNAFFHAPADASGRRLHADLPRTTPLAADRPVLLRYGSDGVNFGLSVCDAHGTLDARRIAQLMTGHLRERRRSLDLTRTSNELGLTSIAEAVSHLVFNIEAGRRTEIIALVEMGGPPRMGRGTGSINVFSSPRPANTPAGQVT